jgi:hypothetical protein
VEELAPLRPLRAFPFALFAVKKKLGNNRMKKEFQTNEEQRISNRKEHKENFAQRTPGVEELDPPRPFWFQALAFQNVNPTNSITYFCSIFQRNPR